MLTTLKQCLGLLTPQERWQWLGMVPLMLVVAVLESVAAALVFGLIQSFNDPAQTVHMPVVATLYQALPGHASQEISRVVTVFVTVFYILKNVVLAVVTYVRGQLVSRSITA